MGRQLQSGINELLFAQSRNPLAKYERRVAQQRPCRSGNFKRGHRFSGAMRRSHGVEPSKQACPPNAGEILLRNLADEI